MTRLTRRTKQLMGVKGESEDKIHNKLNNELNKKRSVFFNGRQQYIDALLDAMGDFKDHIEDTYGSDIAKEWRGLPWSKEIWDQVNKGKLFDAQETLLEAISEFPDNIS